MDTTLNAGAVHVLSGSADGTTVRGNQFWHQDVQGIEAVADEWDYFGCSLLAILAMRYRVYLPLAVKNN
jgi:hypothetical protein